MSAPSKYMTQCMLVFWIASLDDQASPCLVNLVTRDPRLQSGESSIIRITSSLEHLLHALRNSSRADKIVSLDVATIPVIFHARDQPFRVIFQSRFQISLHTRREPIRCTLIIACVHSDLLRLPPPNKLVQLGCRALATIPDYFIIELLLPNSLFFETPNNCSLRPGPFDDSGRTPGKVAESEILHQRILVAFSCERNPHVNPLRLHAVPDKLQLLPQEL